MPVGVLGLVNAYWNWLMSSLPPVWCTMLKIFTTMFVGLYLSSLTLSRVVVAGGGRATRRSGVSGAGSKATKSGAGKGGDAMKGGGDVVVYAEGQWFTSKKDNRSKYYAEIWILKYSACWIASVGVVIATGAYEWWGKWGYIIYCGSCAAPALAWPLNFPLKGDKKLPKSEWYILKANLWIAIFSFIGNYWYTHYFYGVLKADYTFEAHRLNNVPISMYLMTHAYFMFYHVLSNCALRYIRSKYVNNAQRFVFECAAIAVMSYSTAFMESLTICGFPYYRFEDRDMAYTLGSAFYGIYFLVSFPMFLRIDEDETKDLMPYSQVFWESMGSGMLVMCLLDFVRLWLRIDFTMKVGGGHF